MITGQTELWSMNTKLALASQTARMFWTDSYGHPGRENHADGGIFSS